MSKLKYLLFSIVLAFLYIPDSIAWDIPYGVQDPLLGSGGWMNCEGHEMGYWNVVQQQGFTHKQTPQGEFIEVTPARMLNWMKHPDQKFWRESLDPSEVKNLEAFLNTLSKTPRIGSGDWMSAAGMAGTAGVLAYRATNDPLAAGAASAAAIVLPSLISRAVLTPSGRWLLTGMIQDMGRHIPTKAMPILATALRAHLDRAPVDAAMRDAGGQTRMPVAQ